MGEYFWVNCPLKNHSSADDMQAHEPVLDKKKANK